MYSEKWNHKILVTMKYVYSLMEVVVTRNSECDKMTEKDMGESLGEQRFKPLLGTPTACTGVLIRSPEASASNPLPTNTHPGKQQLITVGFVLPMRETQSS